MSCKTCNDQQYYSGVSGDEYPCPDCNKEKAEKRIEAMSRRFVNIYFDENGRFISDQEFSTWKGAYGNRDELDNYIETVEIINP